MENNSRRYSLAFKLKVLDEVESGQESAPSASLKYGIGGSMTIYRWFAQKKAGRLRDRPRTVHVMSSKPQPSASKSTAKTALEKENEFLKLQVLAYQIMIEEAEKEYGITLKKKSDSVPSNDSKPFDPEPA